MDFNQILGALQNMAPKDPAAVNPATTAAMARSRDTISKILERELGRQSEPFAGLNDVATAATAALTSRGKTPFGQALQSMDLGRAQKTAQIAGTLGNLASKEAALAGRGQMTPYQSSQLAMRQLQFLASRGDRDASLVNQAINQIRTNLEPEDAVGFVVDAHSALQEAQRQAGRPLSGDEAVAIVTRQASGGGYRARQPNLQGFINPITGDREVMNPKTGQWGAGATAGAIPQRAPPVSAVPGVTNYPGVQPAPAPPGATTSVPILRNPTQSSGVPTQPAAPQPPAPQPPVPAPGIPAVVAQPNLKAIPETAKRVGTILRAITMSKDVPEAFGYRGMLIDSLGGLAQQVEASIGAQGALGTEQYRVNEVARVRDQLNLLFADLLPTITGDKSGRYSNFDVQLATKVARFKSAASSFEQSLGFMSLIRDIEIRQLRKELVLAGPGGQALYNTLSDEVKQALSNPAVVGQDGEAPYDDIRMDGGKVYVRMKGTQQWSEVRR